MSFFKIIGFAITGLVIILVLKRLKDEYAYFVSLLLSAGLMVCAVGIISPVVDYLKNLSLEANMRGYVTVLFKTCGIALITTLSADICRDCGETALSSKVELCGKCTILALSLPLIKGVFEAAFNILA